MPEREAAPGVRRFLDAVPPELRGRVAALRAVVRREAPAAKESVLWGALSYHRPYIGGRVRGAVCLISSKGGRVRLEFIHGVRLADPAGLLRGRGVSKRHVGVETVAAARRPEVAALVRAAVALDPSTWESAPQRGAATRAENAS